MLAVDPTHQRAGYGRAMMLAGEEHLRSKGCTAVDICVISWRTELPPIYRGFGYVETGVEEFRPSQRLKPGVGSCHCIVMTKTL
jgi:ribosomal protein S18 acetylase RimI-like enzyme